MISPGLPELLALVLGGGGVAAVQGVVKAFAAYRDGARARERDVLTDSESWRRASDDARREAERDADWWRDRAVALWLSCSQHGGEPGPLGAPPDPPPGPPTST